MALELAGDEAVLAPMKCSTSTIGRLVAIAPRVANDTDKHGRREHQDEHADARRTPMAPAMVRMRSIQAR